MNTHTVDTFTQLLNDNLLRNFQTLFDRFRHDLDGALERADKHYSQHMPSKGDVCEAAVRKYLSETLGSRYAVTDGQIFDSTAAISKQQDVIIFDDYWSIRLTPRNSDEPAIIPVEFVYATIEVKKTLTSTDLRDAINNIRSFKSLKREITGPEHVTPNKSITNLGAFSTKSVRNSYFSAIFAFTAGRSMTTVLEQLKREVQDIPVQEWPDVVIVHNEGIILPYCATCNASGATHISQIAADGHTPTYFLDELTGSYSLLGFHLLVLQHLHYTILRPLDFHDMYGKLASVARFLANLKQNPSTSDAD